jgi:hypothetical protein
MENSLTVAEKVRRQLKAGRPRKTKAVPRTVLEAVQRLVDEADRAQSLMQKYGLHANDIKLALLCHTDDPRRPSIWPAQLPPPGNIGAYFDDLETRTAGFDARFLGILWQQTDHEVQVKGQPMQSLWITEFSKDGPASLELLAYHRAMVSSLQQQQ